MFETGLWTPNIIEREYDFSYPEEYILSSKERIWSMWTDGWAHAVAFGILAAIVGGFAQNDLVRSTAHHPS